MRNVAGVLALLLGAICALSLALSALLSRTTTSGVLAYVAVFALTLGTLITFGLTTAITTEKYTETYGAQPCPDANQLAAMDPILRAQILGTCGRPTPVETSRARTDRTWWLLAPNPFVILADAAPQLPPLSAEEKRRRATGDYVQDARDIDPLGGIGRAVRDLRKPPAPVHDTFSYGSDSPDSIQLTAKQVAQQRERKPVWPWGLAFDVLLATLALWLTTRRLATPTRNLPKGQRVA